MNEIEVQRQIEQMVMFIKQEANEKANEIRVSADEEFNLERLNLLEIEKKRIKKEFERKEGQVEASKKIEASKQLNEQRLKILGAKQAAIRSVIEAAKAEIQKTVKSPAQYGPLIVDLLCQAMKKMADPSMIVQCRKEDLTVVEKQLSAAQARFKQTYGTDAPQLTLDRQHFLPPGAKSKEEEDDPDYQTCLGGVVTTSLNGRIVVNNSLDARLKIIEEEKLPTIRESLFGSA